MSQKHKPMAVHTNTHSYRQRHMSENLSKFCRFHPRCYDMPWTCRTAHTHTQTSTATKPQKDTQAIDFLATHTHTHTHTNTQSLVGGWLTGRDYVRAVFVNQDQTPPPNLWPHHRRDNQRLSENCAEKATSLKHVCVCVHVGGCCIKMCLCVSMCETRRQMNG